MGLFLSYLSPTLYQKSSHHTLLLWLFTHTLKLPLLLRFLSLGWITTALLLLYSQIQHPPGPNRRKILKHASQGTSPGRTAWLITVIRLMGKDYLIETTGHLSHPTHWERLTSHPQGCYFAALQSLCLALVSASAPAAAPWAEGTAESLRAWLLQARLWSCHSIRCVTWTSISPEAPGKPLQGTAQCYQEQLSTFAASATHFPGHSL